MTGIINNEGEATQFCRYKEVITPYEKLKSLTYAKDYLKLGINFEILDRVAVQVSDNEEVDLLQKRYVKNRHMRR